jgi:hypothetical protein
MELVIHQTGMCSHDEMPVGHNTEIWMFHIRFESFMVVKENKPAQAIMLPACIWEVAGSSLSQDTDYRDLHFHCFPWSLQAICGTVEELLAKKSITKMDCPPYSPDLATCDFWLFPKLKRMPWRDKGLLTFLTSNAKWQRYCEAFRKIIFKTVSSSGTVVSRSAQLHKASISKAIVAASA